MEMTDECDYKEQRPHRPAPRAHPSRCGKRSRDGRMSRNGRVLGTDKCEKPPLTSRQVVQLRRLYDFLEDGKCVASMTRDHIKAGARIGMRGKARLWRHVGFVKGEGLERGSFSCPT
eukprot:1291301-Amorphochlora_amoeboformis.AAC.2